MSEQATETTATDERSYFGKDCPVGMVQVEFVGVDPTLRHGQYGYKPSQSAFLEVYVDGQRFHIGVGDVIGSDGKTRRGLHIVTDRDVTVDHRSVNAVDLFVQPISDQR